MKMLTFKKGEVIFKQGDYAAPDRLEGRRVPR